MRTVFLLLSFLPAMLSAQLLSDELPQGVTKRLLLAHPTKSTITVIHTLQQEGLLNLEAIELIGVYHVHETYDYSKSQLLLDSLTTLNMQLIPLNDTLMVSNLYTANACSDAFEELFTKSAGAFFFGGPDIPPVLYGEQPHPRTKVTDPFRHYFEASFLFHLLGGRQNTKHTAYLKKKPDYFVHGFCLGMQTMNVATGGTMIQDIPSEVYHSDETAGLGHLPKEQIHRNYYAQLKDQCCDVQGSHFHSIRFKGKKLAKKVGATRTLQPQVNSYHHQAVKKTGKGFKVGATSQDKKVVEAIWHKKYANVFAVQFHPERSELYLPTREYSFEPQGEQKQLSEWMDKESMDFHRGYWVAVNGIIRGL
ncbi:MAG: gamma-glutamyl-gamma-aminobutyrate hydrolase family protein [Marinilabiliaceae bacterium]|nr:gamma-glutamyl-gamma-aminobutyrate hydrolase family protein [Marinilabiliaceae bacterium]